jgi:hypothetical protein
MSAYDLRMGVDPTCIAVTTLARVESGRIATCYAGHDLNHFAQIEAILASAGTAPQDRRARSVVPRRLKDRLQGMGSSMLSADDRLARRPRTPDPCVARAR